MEFLNLLKRTKAGGPIAAEIEAAEREDNARTAAIKVFAECERAEAALPPLRDALAKAEKQVVAAKANLAAAEAARLAALAAHDGAVYAIEARRRRAACVLRNTAPTDAIMRYVDALDAERAASTAHAMRSVWNDTGRIHLWSGKAVKEEWSAEPTGREWLTSLVQARAAALALTEAPLTADEFEGAIAAIESQRFRLASVTLERVG